jgi:hypothetical protein
MLPKYFHKNLAVVFSSRNILPCLKLAIYSFLHFYPELRQNIIVYDSSTDDTQEWLRSENIAFCSCDPDDLAAINNSGYSHSCRVNNLFNHIFASVTRKYLFISDGDVVFLRGGFLEHYISLLSDYTVFVIISSSFRDKFSVQSVPETSQYLELWDANGFLHRIFLYHAFLDLETLKKEQIVFDSNRSPEYIRLLGNSLDCGVDFLYQLIKKDVAYYSLAETINSYVLHFGFVSCTQYERAAKNLNYQNFQRILSLYSTLLKEETLAKLLTYPHVAEIVQKYQILLGFVNSDSKVF